MKFGETLRQRSIPQWAYCKSCKGDVTSNSTKLTTECGRQCRLQWSKAPDQGTNLKHQNSPSHNTWTGPFERPMDPAGERAVPNPVAAARACQPLHQKQTWRDHKETRSA